MKFGFFSPYLDTIGGGERYMLTLASHLAQSHLVDIFWDDQNVKAPLSRFLKINLTKARITNNIFRENFFKKSYMTLGYNLIFILSDGSVPTTIAAKNILHFQVPFNFPEVSILTKLKLLKYNWIITNSLFTKHFIDKSFKVSSKVIYPPVDVKNLHPGKKEKIILSVGRLSKKQLHPKKQEVLIDVFKEVYKKARDWRLILVGQVRKEDQKYVRFLKSNSRGYAIKIIENLSYDKLCNLYEKASIYWHATGFDDDENKNPEKMEHFGIATVEASAAGAVPIVIAKGGQKEIITDGKNGRYFLTKSELFRATTDVIKDRDQFKKLSQEAIKNSKRFSKEVFLREYEKIIF